MVHGTNTEYTSRRIKYHFFDCTINTRVFGFTDHWVGLGWEKFWSVTRQLGAHCLGLTAAWPGVGQAEAHIHNPYLGQSGLSFGQ